MKKAKTLTTRILPVIFWLFIWQIAAVLIHNKILMAGPLETVEALVKMAGTGDYWLAVRNSTLRILLGFLTGSVLGITAAYFAYKNNIAKILIRPIAVMLKTVPVASFAVLLLIWIGSRNISVLICSMVVFPILYLSTLQGLESTDKNLLEMAQVFRMPGERKLRFIFLPQLAPFLKSAVKLAIGMSFKSGAAAEVIGQPMYSMGNGLYQAKIYLETGELFAWTVTIILISFICEKILMRFFK